MGRPPKPSGHEKLVSFNYKIPESLARRWQAFCVSRQSYLTDELRVALERYMKAEERKDANDKSRHNSFRLRHHRL